MTKNVRVHRNAGNTTSRFAIHSKPSDNEEICVSPDLCLDSELHKQVFHPGGVHLLAVSVSSRPFILFISRPSLQFPMVLCLCKL